MSLVPWVRSLPYADPTQIFAYFCHLPFAILLESTKLQDNFGRFSFIGIDPFETLVVKNGIEKSSNQPVHLFDTIRQWLTQYPSMSHAQLPPFQGGIMGLWSYECGHYVEKLPYPESTTPDTPDCVLGCYDLVIAFDHVQKTTYAIANGYPHQTSTARQQHAQQRLDWLCQQLAQVPPTLPINHPILETAIECNFTEARYQKAVEIAKEYILAGDIFEVNLSQCFSCQVPDDFSPFSLYQRLKSLNPAPFAGFFNADNITVISSSPERFVRCIENQVTTCPIKGTAKRNADPVLDKKLALQLLNSEKDKAENVMIVDLMRNDLSRVCLAHSVKVPKLCELQTFETVHHLVSTVEGTLAPQHTTVDLLEAIFPGGSITGAPKIRSMEIITEIEQQPRGPYCGSLGYLGFDGNLDTSIAIRTFTLSQDTLYWQAGGAVTMDSDPLEEYLETLAKAAALKKALVTPA